MPFRMSLHMRITVRLTHSLDSCVSPRVAPRLTARLRASSNPGMDVPEEIRELPDATIRVRETGPGFFEVSFKPTDPLHIARNGYTLDTNVFEGAPSPRYLVGPKRTGVRTTRSAKQ